MSQYGCHIPELIFCNLYTSSNYDDEDDKYKRKTGGMNGLGAKVTNIYSKKFIVDTVHENDGGGLTRYYQESHDNMSKILPPHISNTDEEPYTKITYYPDL
jgi:DNA topoisomerase II